MALRSTRELHSIESVFHFSKQWAWRQKKKNIKTLHDDVLVALQHSRGKPPPPILARTIYNGIISSPKQIKSDFRQLFISTFINVSFRGFFSPFHIGTVFFLLTLKVSPSGNVSIGSIDNFKNGTTKCRQKGQNLPVHMNYYKLLKNSPSVVRGFPKS